VADLVEAKLSPKYPPKGAICEVWDEGEEERCVGIADGEGKFSESSNGRSIRIGWDHFRVIPTAEDALRALDEEIDDDACIYTHTAAYRDGIRAAMRSIQRIIDNAMEG